MAKKKEFKPNYPLSYEEQERIEKELERDPSGLVRLSPEESERMGDMMSDEQPYKTDGKKESRKKWRPFNESEKEFIRNSLGKLSLHEIAEELGHSRRKLDQFLVENNLSPGDDTDPKVFQAIIKSLHKEPFWADMRKKYGQHDLSKFQFDWVRYIIQFNQDIRASEKDQLKHALEISIMMDHLKISERQNKLLIGKLEREIAEEYQYEKSARDEAKLAYAEAKVAASRSAMMSADKEWRELQQVHGKILKDLNATREKRVAKFELSRSTFPRMLEVIEETPLKKKQMGVSAYLIYLAFVKAKYELLQPHQYQNMEEDFPLLVADSERSEFLGHLVVREDGGSSQGGKPVSGAEGNPEGDLGF